MVRLSRFAFDDSRDPQAAPMPSPLEGLDDPDWDGPVSAALEPPDGIVDDEPDSDSERWDATDDRPKRAA